MRRAIQLRATVTYRDDDHAIEVDTMARKAAEHLRKKGFAVIWDTWEERDD